MSKVYSAFSFLCVKNYQNLSVFNIFSEKIKIQNKNDKKSRISQFFKYSELIS